jgi:hypothetical protein
MSMRVGSEKDTYKNIRTSAVIETAVQLNIFYTKSTECRGPENDVHTRAARLRLILFSKDIGAF